LIDLHLHTTASDGLRTPEQLVEEAHAAGLTTIAVTDHDTVAATRHTERLARQRGINAVPGIEITSIENGRDVHLLGYFIDQDHQGLSDFLRQQRAQRMARVQAIAEQLASLGVPIDIGPLLASAEHPDGRSIGRPQIARALVDAGHVADTVAAFDVWLGRGRPGFVPRCGASPEQVIAIIHEAGGLASLAHPGTTAIDDRLSALRDAGLDAIEVFHSDHAPEVSERYRAMASTLDLLMTGGSDYHGDPAHGLAPGSVTLPANEWQRIIDRMRWKWQPR
jgi:predicted metal-dependent phosphoesterase TrpH